jgi:hypothetical protein
VNPELMEALCAASEKDRMAALRMLLLEHPNAVEDNGRVTLDLPREFSHRVEVSTKFLADWLAPEADV